MNDNMYTPKSVIDRIIGHSKALESGKETVTNWNVCVKIPYKEFLISLAIDSSLGDNDLKRADFLVEKDGKDVSKDFYTDPEQYMLYGSMETLLSICSQIDAIELKKNPPCPFCKSTIGVGEYEGSTDWPRCMNCGAC